MNAPKRSIRTLLLTFCAAAALGFTVASCSSGTEDGATNVEKGTTKSRNPEKGNPNALNNRDRGSTSEEERDESANTKNQKNYYKDRDRKNE